MNIIATEDPTVFIDTAFRYASDNFPIFSSYVENKMYLDDQDDASVDLSLREIYLKGMDTLIDPILNSYGLSFYNDDIRASHVTNVYDLYRLTQFLVFIGIENLTSIIKSSDETFENFLDNFTDIWNPAHDGDATEEAFNFLRDLTDESHEISSICHDSIRFDRSFVTYLSKVRALSRQISINVMSTDDMKREAFGIAFIRLLTRYTESTKQYVLGAYTMVHHTLSDKIDLTVVRDGSDELIQNALSLVPRVLSDYIERSLVTQDDKFVISKELFASLLSDINVDFIRNNKQTTTMQEVLAYMTMSIMLELIRSKQDDFDLSFIKSDWFKSHTDKIFEEMRKENLTNPDVYETIYNQLVRILSLLEEKNTSRPITIFVKIPLK